MGQSEDHSVRFEICKCHRHGRFVLDGEDSSEFCSLTGANEVLVEMQCEGVITADEAEALMSHVPAEWPDCDEHADPTVLRECEELNDGMIDTSSEDDLGFGADSVPLTVN
jgi:hypothetical protein